MTSSSVTRCPMDKFFLDPIMLVLKLLFRMNCLMSQWVIFENIKQQKNRRVLYITYGRGRKYGGGAWSENIDKVHPSTYKMIRDHLGQPAVDELKKLMTTKQKETTNG